MVNCYVNNCPSKSGKKIGEKNVTLHAFLSNLDDIKDWLRQSGQCYSDIDNLALSILADRNKHFYRVCSNHFKPEFVIAQEKSNLLSVGAKPSMFDDANDRFTFKDILYPQATKRRRLERVELPHSSQMTKEGSSQTSSFEAADSCSHKCHAHTQRFQEVAKSVMKDHTYPVHFTSVDMEIRQSNTGTCSHSAVHSREPIALEMLPQATSTPSKADRRRARKQVENIILQESLILPIELDEPSPSTDLPADETSIATGNSAVKDPDFVPNFEDEHDSSMQISHEETIEPVDYVNEKKYLVFESCLDRLFYRQLCNATPDCLSPMHSLKKSIQGSMLSVKGCCESGHEYLLWESQPRIKGKPVGNILTASAILFSGSNYTKVHEYNNILGMQQIEENTFYKYQRRHLFGVVDHHWQLERDRVKSVVGQQPLHIAGDGQCDSPGHNAKFLIYTVMDMRTDLIVDFEVVQCTQCTSSNSMEKEGFKIVLDRLKDKGYNPRLVATDRHVSVRKLMRERYSTLKHQFDVWHYAKSLKKKLFAVCSKKLCRDLLPWISSILTHFWWSVETCEGQESVLKEKWESLLMHITNRHSWSHGEHYKQCAHKPLTSEKIAETAWLNANSPAFEALHKFVTDGNLQKDFAHLKHYCHTGGLEVFHSHILKFRSKRFGFRMNAMEARTKLGVLAHNYNVKRKQAIVKKAKRTSEPKGTKRTKLVFRKQQKRWVVRTLYEPMSNAHIQNLLHTVLKSCAGEFQSNWESREHALPATIATIEKPTKVDAKSAHRTRFQSK